MGRGKEYAIPDGVTTIAPSACTGNQLEQVVIPRGVAVIGSSAFSRNRLTSVTIPPGVKKIAHYAFSLNELTRVIIGMDVEVGGGGAGGFEDGFDSVYKRGGKKAGEYTKTGDTWNYAPLDKELAAAYLDFKTIARVRAKKTALIAKKAAFVLAMIVGIIPTACSVLVGLLIQNVLGLIIAIPWLCIRLLMRLFRKIRGGKIP
jgi:hypothetical protein